MPDDDDYLVERAKAGDLDAFNSLVLRHQDRIFTVAYHIMNSHDAAADMAQDAFIAAYQKLDTFQGGRFIAWLSRIVTNRCYDELRRHKRRPQILLDDMVDESYADGPPIPSDAPTPEEEAERSDLSNAIQGCIEHLSDDQRVVIVLSDVQGLAYNEIADALNVNLGTVKSRLSRARLSVRRCLQIFQELLPPDYRLNNTER